MTRAFRLGQYSVYVYREVGQPHHRPHAHIKLRDQRIATVYIETLEFSDTTERIPKKLRQRLGSKQADLLELWRQLNDE